MLVEHFLTRVYSIILRYPVPVSLGSVLLVCFLAPFRFPNLNSYDKLTETEILANLHHCPKGNYSTHVYVNDLCPEMTYSVGSFDHVNTVLDNYFFNNMANELKISPGGRWSPTSCIPWQKVAIIVPYRDRLKQLQLFLQHMHPFLQAQKLDYVIVVVEQTARYQFNRGKLLNVGFAETAKDQSFCCFIFHDVDLFPESTKNIYGCSQQPRHMCSAINTFRYVLPYPELFGGVVAFTRKQFKFVNGYSNLYFGWGAEDDDLYNRVMIKGMKVHRWETEFSRYTMLNHAKATPNPYRYSLLSSGPERMETDGLNSLHYTVIKKKLEPLFTHILVDIT